MSLLIILLFTALFEYVYYDTLTIDHNTKSHSEDIDDHVLSIPGIGVFFYPWYGRWRHWNASGYDPPYTWSSHYIPDIIEEAFIPEIELYDSSDEKIILWQLYMMRKAHVSYAIVSWWGPNSYEDKVFDKLMNISTSPLSPHPKLKWCILYELEGYGDPDLNHIVSDLKYIIKRYGSRENYLKINGKPVAFVYADPEDGPEYARKWFSAKTLLENSLYIVLKVFPRYENYANLSDSWYQYAPSNEARYELQPPYSGFVSPGFWRIDEENPILDRNIDLFKENLIKLLNSNVGIKTIQTWNEWHEGTQVEPGQVVDTSTIPYKPLQSYGDKFIEIMRQCIPNPYSYDPEIEVNIHSIYNNSCNMTIMGRGFPSETTLFINIDNKVNVGNVSTDRNGEFTYTINYEFEDQGLHIVIVGINGSIAIYPICIKESLITSSKSLALAVEESSELFILIILVITSLVIIYYLSNQKLGKRL